MKRIALLWFALSLFACVSVSDYQGSWEGKFDGVKDEGEIRLKMNAQGGVLGTVFSQTYRQTFLVKGSVDKNGVLKVVIDEIDGGGEFVGKITGDEITGTWKNTTHNITGMWQASRN